MKREDEKTAQAPTTTRNLLIDAFKEEGKVTQVYGITPNKLVDVIFKGVDTRIVELEKKLELKENSDVLLTRQQTADLLSVSLVCLHYWQKKGILPAYKIGKIVRYKLKDVNDKLIKI